MTREGLFDLRVEQSGALPLRDEPGPGPAADHHRQLRLEIDLCRRTVRQHDRLAVGQQRRRRLEKDQRRLGELRPGLRSMRAVVSADREDVGRGDGRQEGAHGHAGGRERELAEELSHEGLGHALAHEAPHAFPSVVGREACQLHALSRPAPRGHMLPVNRRRSRSGARRRASPPRRRCSSSRT